MKKSKWAIALLVIALVMGLGTLVTACGEEETTTTAAPETTAATEPETTSTEAATTTSEAGTPEAGSGETFELKFSYHSPVKASVVGAYFQPWTDAITAATGGRVTITHYAEESLVKEEQQLDALLSGTSDIALIEPEFNASVFPRTEFGSLPGLFPSVEAASDIFWDIVQEYCQDEWKDMQVLGVVVLSGGPFISTKEVKLPADLKGMRVRSGGKVETWLIETLGGTPVEISLGDLATSMERGMADGLFLSWSMVLSQGLHEVTKYRLDNEMFYRCWVLAMNKDKWESLPADLQEAIMSASGKENSTKYNIANDKVYLEGRKAVEAYDKKVGNPPIYVPTPEEKAQWVEASKPVWDKWVTELGADQPGQEIIDRVTELVKQYQTE